ncbi:MAG: iron-sulfur cluster assembly scaffold protein [Terriglobales bacterium]
MYSARLLDHFQNPRNAGDVAGPDAVAQLENPACGDILRLTLRVVDGRIAEIRFRAKGCVPSMACGSALTELLLGRTIEEARQLRREEIVKAVGGLPKPSSHASHLAMDTLASLLQQLKM